MCSCICLGIEVQDLFGSLGSASDRSLLRYATDSTGHVKYDKGVLRLSNNPEDMTHHVGEGCNVFGTMYVESVPGNFHVSLSNQLAADSTHSGQAVERKRRAAHARLHVLWYVAQFLPALSYQHLAVFYPQQFINTSHHVHYLYFGDMTRKQVKHERLAIVMDSIHDHERIVEDDDSAAAQDRHLTQVAGRSAGTGPPPPPQHHFSKSFEYYLKIVHTQYSPSPSQTFHTYQYTSHGNDLVIPRQLPAIYFRYDFSPVTVKIEKRRRSFAHFLTDICAVVGGVLTVLKLINTVFRMRATSSSDATKGSPHNERTLAAPVAALPTTHAPAQHNGYASGGLNGHPSPTAFATPFTTSYASSDNAYSGQAAAAIDSKPMLSPTHYPARASFSTGSPPASAVSPSSYGQSPPAHSFGQQAQQPQQQFVYQQQQQQQQNGGGSGVQRQYVGTAQPRKVYGAHDD